ncbi:hypothetical protein WJX81_005469 [Elliptochloris bilobata]|uniref:Uncharacterized protein n=1 Tax=Elliptochloris bilobata TaxID=381761 RepID=A0AAW1R0L2_9CHLO
MCRQSLPAETPGVCKRMAEIVEKLFPGKLMERRAEVAARVAAACAQQAELESQAAALPGGPSFARFPSSSPLFVDGSANPICWVIVSPEEMRWSEYSLEGGRELFTGLSREELHWSDLRGDPQGVRRPCWGAPPSFQIGAQHGRGLPPLEGLAFTMGASRQLAMQLRRQPHRSGKRPRRRTGRGVTMGMSPEAAQLRSQTRKLPRNSTHRSGRSAGRGFTTGTSPGF